MSWAVRYLHGQAERLSRFQHRGAFLPVSARRGAQIVLMPWGRRPDEPGKLPKGGWAHLTHLQGGVWDQFGPKPVRLPVYEFAERDVTGREHWFMVTRGQFLQGCVATLERERRVYVVTLDCAPDVGEFERWPRLVIAPT